MNFYLSYSTFFQSNSWEKNGFVKQRKNNKQKQTLDITKYCVDQLRKNYKNVFLITDKHGELLFKDLPWTNIYTDLESIPKKYREVWSLGKLYAINFISKKEKPFLHIDYDFFITKKLSNKILNSEILLQSREYECGGGPSEYKLNIYEKYCKNKFIKNYQRMNYVYNCGIMGGTNYKFWQEYSEKAIKVVEDKQNEKYWLKDFKFQYFVKACVAEQYFLACLLHEKKIRANLLFDNSNKIKIGINNYDPFDITYFKKTGAIHALGSNKNMLFDDKGNVSLECFIDKKKLTAKYQAQYEEEWQKMISKTLDKNINTPLIIRR